MQEPGKNVMYFENGVRHEFSEAEMNLLKGAVRSLCCNGVGEKEGTEELTELKALFLENLD